MTMMSQNHKSKGNSSLVSGTSPIDTSKMSMSSYSSMKVYCAPPQEVAYKLKSGEKGLNSCAFSPFGGILATAGDDHYLRIWEDGTESKSFKPFLCPLSTVVFNANGSLIGVAGTDEQIAIINRKPNMNIRQKFSGHGDCINSLHFDKANNHMLSGSADRTVRVWDLNRGEQIK